ncbi:hypothetical protein FN846DRAFT_153238 [Sphaerosporella brunnea]|uniref:Autophagy-related protein 8 n=1 Tax=Sphaerosporella brunnea TaxID=1250544 RepID=A0A5J5F8M4_9PEZI|nr:hypothetical protein FN846DRAFT_153238 [Sphaerosporella brunnea]
MKHLGQPNYPPEKHPQNPTSKPTQRSEEQKKKMASGTYKSHTALCTRRTYFTRAHISSPIPLILEPSPSTRLPALRTAKLVLHPTSTFTTLTTLLQKCLLLPHQSHPRIYLFVNNELINPSRSIEAELRENADGEDGGLYVVYSDKPREEFSPPLEARGEREMGVVDLRFWWRRRS